MRRRALVASVLCCVACVAGTPGFMAAQATPQRCPENRIVMMPIPTPRAGGDYTYAQGDFAQIASDGGGIVVHAEQRFTVGVNKFGFNKLQGSSATVAARRLDGDAPPAGVRHAPTGSYPSNFEVLGLAF